ncbi:hypothetical protein CORC01_07941 [Colletotrichum orchidophilum]|uniref:Secreted protein n=1 Tax=Colletotrichum orchidophilum TaxID=1209926 RepID=A0A1G4B686_9PEZI|nr:uncharacterized protein CORC01_07941 [Colletotrichum orchidophilum]OHE96795.1 hypothetical protein CORC01_07941 [Colletotrichum orchidophilum]
MKSFINLFLAATAATGVMSFAFSKPVERRHTGAELKLKLANDVVNSAAYKKFMSTEVLHPKVLKARKNDDDDEPDPNRNATIPDAIYVLQCVEERQGFHGLCGTFSSSPGQCVSYYDYNHHNTTDISKPFNNKVSSLSVGSGGKCQFYKYKFCDNKNDDSGLTSSYNFDLSVALPEDPRTVEYDNQITSWRC